jgi:hypothetical protein
LVWEPEKENLIFDITKASCGRWFEKKRYIGRDLMEGWKKIVFP